MKKKRIFQKNLIRLYILLSDLANLAGKWRQGRANLVGKLRRGRVDLTKKWGKGKADLESKRAKER